MTNAPPPDDRAQLDFLQHVQRIFDEGEFVATYKFALLIALIQLLARSAWVQHIRANPRNAPGGSSVRILVR